MQLYPAIDIKNGQCVRLTQGLFDNVKVYYNTPRDAAMLWEEMGGSFLHVVDLDGALAGRPVNLEAVGQISGLSVFLWRQEAESAPVRM